MNPQVFDRVLTEREQSAKRSTSVARTQPESTDRWIRAEMGGSLSFSVVTAVFDPEPEHLAECLASVSTQRYDGIVEHVVVDDGSTGEGVASVLAGAVRSVADPRRPVDVRVRAANGGIVVASNDALGVASGDWVVLLDHDDVLADGAVAALARAIADRPDADLVYGDHDLLRPDGRTASPVFKPDLSPEWLRQHNYVTHLVAVRRSVLLEVGGFRVGTDGAQDHDLLLRLLEHGARVVHVPEVLLHWRQSPRSVATEVTNKPEAFAAGRRVVAEHLERLGIDARLHDGPPGVVRIERILAREPLVSVVIPTRGSSGRIWGRLRTFVVDAVRSIAERSSYRNLELVVVADAETPGDVSRRLRRIADESAIPVRIVPFDDDFNFSAKINRGVAAALGELVLVLNDDTELIEPGSIGEMVGLLVTEPPDEGAWSTPVGAVGAKLLYPDGTLQHAGHLYHGEFMHTLIGWDGDHPGPNRMLSVVRECSGVTAAAMLVPRALLERIGGFPEDLPLHFNDVDVCRSITASGHRILWTPHASWYHFEGRSRERGASMDEWRRVAARWPTERPTDPYANPNLVPRRADWLELPGRSGAPSYDLDDDGRRIWA